MSNTNTKIQVLYYTELAKSMPVEDVKEVIESVEKINEEQSVVQVQQNEKQIYTPIIYPTGNTGLRV